MFNQIKKSMKKYLIFTLLFSVFISCSKKNDDPKPQNTISESDIIGTWLVYDYENIIAAKGIEDDKEMEGQIILKGLEMENSGYELTFNSDYTINTHPAKDFKLKITEILNGNIEEENVTEFVNGKHVDENGATTTVEFEDFISWELKNDMLFLTNDGDSDAQYPFKIEIFNENILDLDTGAVVIEEFSEEEEGELTLQFKIGLKKK